MPQRKKHLNKDHVPIAEVLDDLQQQDITSHNWRTLYEQVAKLHTVDGSASQQAGWGHDWIKQLAQAKLKHDPEPWQRRLFQRVAKSPWQLKEADLLEIFSPSIIFSRRALEELAPWSESKTTPVPAHELLRTAVSAIRRQRINETWSQFSFSIRPRDLPQIRKYVEQHINQVDQGGASTSSTATNLEAPALNHSQTSSNSQATHSKPAPPGSPIRQTSHTIEASHSSRTPYNTRTRRSSRTQQTTQAPYKSYAPQAHNSEAPHTCQASHISQSLDSSEAAGSQGEDARKADLQAKTSTEAVYLGASAANRHDVQHVISRTSDSSLDTEKLEADDREVGNARSNESEAELSDVEDDYLPNDYAASADDGDDDSFGAAEPLLATASDALQFDQDETGDLSIEQGRCAPTPLSQSHDSLLTIFAASPEQLSMLENSPNDPSLALSNAVVSANTNILASPSMRNPSAAETLADVDNIRAEDFQTPRLTYASNQAISSLSFQADTSNRDSDVIAKFATSKNAVDKKKSSTQHFEITSLTSTPEQVASSPSFRFTYTPNRNSNIIDEFAATEADRRRDSLVPQKRQRAADTFDEVVPVKKTQNTMKPAIGISSEGVTRSKPIAVDNAGNDSEAQTHLSTYRQVIEEDLQPGKWLHSCTMHALLDFIVAGSHGLAEQYEIKVIGDAGASLATKATRPPRKEVRHMFLICNVNENHWVGFYMNLALKISMAYDPMEGSLTADQTLLLARNFVASRCGEDEWVLHNWKLQVCTGPSQVNSHDCGILTVEFLFNAYHFGKWHYNHSTYSSTLTRNILSRIITRKPLDYSILADIIPTAPATSVTETILQFDIMAGTYTAQICALGHIFEQQEEAFRVGLLLGSEYHNKERQALERELVGKRRRVQQELDRPPSELLEDEAEASMRAPLLAAIEKKEHRLAVVESLVQQSRTHMTEYVDLLGSSDDSAGANRVGVVAQLETLYERMNSERMALLPRKRAIKTQLEHLRNQIERCLTWSGFEDGDIHREH